MGRLEQIWLFGLTAFVVSAFIGQQITNYDIFNLFHDVKNIVTTQAQINNDLESQINLILQQLGQIVH